MKVFLYRFSLTERDQGDLFQTSLSRQDFLRDNFKKTFRFSGWGGVSLLYQYIQEDDEVIAGAICRWISEVSEANPDDPFAEVEGGRWLRAAFFFNIEDHQQVFAIEHNGAVGAPSSILSSLVKLVNTRSEGFPYHIEVAELNVKGSFRQAIESYPGPITTLSFRYVVPNPPDVEKETREALKKLGKHTGAEEVVERLKSSSGIKVDSDYIRDAVEYVEDGGGDVTAKDGGRVIFKSSQRVRTEDVSDELAPRGTPISGIASVVKWVLRR